MAFIIPNATNVGSSNRYKVLDQAEPDSIDFEVLGNAGNSGVVSGCVASITNSTTIAVSEGVVVINGAVYSVSAASFNNFTTATYKRFDLILARLSGSSVSFVVLEGATDSNTNPEFPLSENSLPTGTTYSATTHYSPDTDVVIAAIYVDSTGLFTAANIVDKRVMLHSGVYSQGTAVPTATEPTGSLYYRNNIAVDSPGSGLYVRNASSDWVEVAQYGSNNVGDTQLRQSAATSVIGRSANSTGNVADISATVNETVLRRDGSGVLGFGTVDSGYVSDFTEAVQDAVAAAIAAGTHSAITVTYDGSSNTLSFAHEDTSTQQSVSQSGGTVIQNVTLDTYGHVTGLGTKTLSAGDVGAISNAGDSSTGYTLTVGGTSKYLRIKDTVDNSHYISFATANLNANRTITFPNETGTVALTSSSITGNAATATKLATARTIDITGDITATAVAFDGSADIAISASVDDSSHKHGAVTRIFVQQDEPGPTSGRQTNDLWVDI